MANRINYKVYQNKPVILLATSPGPSGAGRVLAAAKDAFPRFAADVRGSISLPEFDKHFDQENAIVNSELFNGQLQEIVQSL